MHRYDAALEMGLVNTSDEVCAGETEFEKESRSVLERIHFSLAAPKQTRPRSMVTALEHPEASLHCPRRVGPNHTRSGDQGSDASHTRDELDACTATRKTRIELQEELDRVTTEAESGALSNKQMKKLERRRRGILAALESSDEGVSRD
jgi:hypothetical protein